MPLIPPSTAPTPETAFSRLLTIMDDLRLNCPWDKKQTLESLRHLTIEETYELSDAILSGDMPEIRKELGDIMLHLVFYARIASETNDFNITDVLNGICDKLVNRHPHIYGDVEVQNEEDVKRNWEQIKLKEGNKSVLGGVPASLPALVKASRIQEKARGVGFDWEEKSQVWAKVEEELQEFKNEFNVEDDTPIDQEKAEGEFGDLLFSLINYARFININPENALEKTNRKFIKRFKYLENKAGENGKKLHDMTLAEMDIFWEEAKKNLTLKFMANYIVIYRIDRLLNFKKMKHNLLFLFPVLFLFLLGSGCSTNSINAALPNNAPEGTFTGQFMLIHVHSKTGITDTLTAALVLNMEMTTGFKITGDTSKLHAGSYGSYIVNSNYTALQFIDKTYPTTGTPSKTHLNGVYNYTYDGTNLQFAAYGALDTLALVYTMKKTGI